MNSETDSAPVLNAQQYARIFSSLTDLLIILDNNGLILETNPALKTLTGYTRSEVIGSPALNLFADAENPVVGELVKHGGSPHSDKCVEARLLRKNGTDFLAGIRAHRLSDERGDTIGIILSVQDISARKHAEEDLMRGALYDAMTGLPNKGLFTDRVHRLFARTRRNDNRAFAVAYLDLDRFKLVNDTHGHAIGDQVLIATARRIESCLRPGDTVARLGGDEFGLLIDEISDAAGATHIINRILEEIAKPLHLQSLDLNVTASVGITVNAATFENYDNPDDLIQHADLAMYRAKDQGRARYEIFDEAMRERTRKRVSLEADLKLALERREFRIFYHPIIALSDMKIVGAEALVRWQHPTLGMIPAGQFLPLAEETGLILPIGEWIFREVLAHQKQWACRVNVALNISSTQFANREFLETFTHTLREEQADSNLIRIDITEKTLMQDIDYSISVLNALNALGIEILVDDFGTGSSSLGYLKRFPISTLKIDRSFISEIPEDDDFTKVVKAAIIMAHTLGLKISAEGVENDAQLEFLKIFECDEAQGYLFNKPMPDDVFASILATSPHTVRQI